ncbi:MAG: FecR domain-containing protein [Tannerellaceae bacterium]|nr:FecR domain-containing protein [Tannerellaceae bacterium]
MTDQKHKHTFNKRTPHTRPDDNDFLGWLKSSSKEKEDLSHYSLVQIFSRLLIREEELPPETQSKMWEQIHTQCKPATQKRAFSFRLPVKYAALIILLLLPLTYIYYSRQFNNQTEETDFLSIMQTLPESNPASGNITLILPDNELLELNNDNVELVHDETGEFRVNGHEVEKTIDNTAPQWLQLHVPYGKSTRITMNDGTRVWVNSGTRLVYPAHFAAHKREIYVAGEIFLEVAQNKEAPFIIKTDLLEISVLGTSFNVSAYKNDREQSVVLATGKVNIQSAGTKEVRTIAPHQRYVLDKNTNDISLQQVDLNEFISWKNGYLYLKDESLTTLIQKIERYYNVQIEYDPVQTQQIQVSGKLDLKENIKDLLEIISVTTPIKYIINENQLKIIV